MTAADSSHIDTPAGVDAAEYPDGKDEKGSRPKHSGTVIKSLSRSNVLAALAALLVVASVGTAAALFAFQYRPDHATDAAAAKSAIDAARDGTIAVLSYSPDTADHDFSSARAHLTGNFLSYYSQFTQQVVAPAVKQKSVNTSAVVLQAATMELHTGSAVVLVYVNQSTASKDRPEPAITSSSVLVSLTKVDGKWLISSFDPI